MDKDLETLSALYDGELDERETRINLEKISLDNRLKNTFHKLGVISELVQRNTPQKASKISFLSDYYKKIHPVITNIVTAAATVMITLIALYQFDDDRFQVDKESSLQLSAALSSEEAKIQLLNADQNIMEHMISIMQSNQSDSSQKVSKNWIPVGSVSYTHLTLPTKA